MAEENETGEARRRYLYRMLRYVPNKTNEEFYNIGVLVYDPDGRLIDARFTPDLRRMRCNPLVELDELRQLRTEFEDKRLLGEDFSGFIEGLAKHLSNNLDLTELRSGACHDLGREVERLVAERLATQARPDHVAESDRRLRGRQAVRWRMAEAFAQHGLVRNGHAMQRDVRIEYGGPRHAFVFDFQYRRPSSEERFVHAMQPRKPEELAERLCFVLQEYRAHARGEAGLTVVAEDSLGEDVRDLLASRGIGTVALSAIHEYAESIRGELGL